MRTSLGADRRQNHVSVQQRETDLAADEHLRVVSPDLALVYIGQEAYSGWLQDLLDGGHAPIGVLCKLATNVPTGAFCTTGSLRSITLQSVSN